MSSLAHQIGQVAESLPPFFHTTVRTVPYTAVHEDKRGFTLDNHKKTPATYQLPGFQFFGAGNGIRTRDFDLGKVALYH